MFTPVDKKRAFESVVHQIESAIYSGHYASGDFLPPERTLMEDFGVGRSTIREALRILESMGLIKTTPGSRSGPQVCSSLTPGLVRLLRGAIQMEEIPVVELLQYRIMAGAAANRLAAHLRTDAHLERMANAIADMEAATDTASFAAADDAFHSVVRAASANRLLEMTADVIQDATLGLVADAVSSTDDTEAQSRFIDIHRQILKALSDKNGAAAAHLAAQSLYDAYAAKLPPEDRARLQAVLPSDVWK